MLAKGATCFRLRTGQLLDRILPMKIIAGTASAVFLLFAFGPSGAPSLRMRRRPRLPTAAYRARQIYRRIGCDVHPLPHALEPERRRKARKLAVGRAHANKGILSVPNWAVVEPRLAGRPPGTDEEFVRLLTTGISRTGARAEPSHAAVPHDAPGCRSGAGLFEIAEAVTGGAGAFGCEQILPRLADIFQQPEQMIRIGRQGTESEMFAKMISRLPPLREPRMHGSPQYPPPGACFASHP